MPEVQLYVAEITQLVEDFRAAGCTDAEVEALILPGLATLQVRGEMAQSVVQDFREGIEDGNLFGDL